MVNDSKSWSEATEKVLAEHKDLWQRLEKGDEGKAWNLANEMALSKSLAERTVELEQRVAELEEHNELLRAAVNQAERLLNMFKSWEDVAISEAIDISEFYLYADKYQAAIGGGALEGKE